MIRVEYNFLCDNCGCQEIVEVIIGQPIIEIVPPGWKRFRANRKGGTDFCPDCKSNERD